MPKWTELFLGKWVTTEDIYFISDVGPDPPTDRQTHPAVKAYVHYLGKKHTTVN